MNLKCNIYFLRHCCNERERGGSKIEFKIFYSKRAIKLGRIILAKLFSRQTDLVEDSNFVFYQFAVFPKLIYLKNKYFFGFYLKNYLTSLCTVVPR